MSGLRTSACTVINIQSKKLDLIYLEFKQLLSWQVLNVLLLLCFFFMVLLHFVAPERVRDVQRIISDYFGDQEPRVRAAALKAMVRDHQASVAQKLNQGNTV